MTHGTALPKAVWSSSESEHAVLLSPIRVLFQRKRGSQQTMKARLLARFNEYIIVSYRGSNMPPVFGYRNIYYCKSYSRAFEILYPIALARIQ